MSNKKQSSKATLAAVTSEMAKPRVAKSAREHPRLSRNDMLVMESKIEK
jgi:hypothetical protein